MALNEFVQTEHLTKKDTKRVLTVIPNMVHGMV